MGFDSKWAWLPQDILDMILEKLTPITDYLRFSAVCKYWYFIAQCQKQTRKGSCNKQLPLLMIPTIDNQIFKRSLYNVTNNKTYDFQLSLAYDRRCSGSSHGWLATVDLNMVITLINPFSKHTIKLPEIKECDGDEFDFYDYQIIKVIVSDDPLLSPDDYVVVAIYFSYVKFAYIKSGDVSWTYVDDKGLQPFCDVVFYKGLVYVVNNDGKTASLAIHNTFDVEKGLQLVTGRNMRCACTTYLVESSMGELLQIRRFMGNDDNDIYKTNKFEIYKLQDSKRRAVKSWRKMKSLGEDAVFLGDNHSMSILATNFPNCKSNCIYFTGDYFHNAHYESMGPFDMGIYNVEDGTIEAHYIMLDSQKYMPPAIWILPQL